MKRLTIHRWPPILVLHIKRFNYTAYTRDKISALVSFPVKGLDLTPFVSHPSDRTTLQRPVYDLYGVSNHIGVLGGGHYTAMCAHRHVNEGSEVGEKWFNFNDGKVSAADEAETQSPIAYVRFYRQRRKDSERALGDRSGYENSRGGMRGGDHGGDHKNS